MKRLFFTLACLFVSLQVPARAQSYGGIDYGTSPVEVYQAMTRFGFEKTSDATHDRDVVYAGDILGERSRLRFMFETKCRPMALQQRWCLVGVVVDTPASQARLVQIMSGRWGRPKWKDEAALFTGPEEGTVVVTPRGDIQYEGPKFEEELQTRKTEDD